MFLQKCSSRYLGSSMSIPTGVFRGAFPQKLFIVSISRCSSRNTSNNVCRSFSENIPLRVPPEMLLKKFFCKCSSSFIFGSAPCYEFFWKCSGVLFLLECCSFWSAYFNLLLERSYLKFSFGTFLSYVPSEHSLSVAPRVLS